MPGRDGTGPAGAGVRTGRGFGGCGGVGAGDARPGRGGRFGMGRGRGRGRRNRFGGRGEASLARAIDELRERVEELEASAGAARGEEHR